MKLDGKSKLPIEEKFIKLQHNNKEYFMSDNHIMLL